MSAGNEDKRLVRHNKVTHRAWVGQHTGTVQLDCEWFQRGYSSGLHDDHEEATVVTCFWCAAGRVRVV